MMGNSYKLLIAIFLSILFSACTKKCSKAYHQVPAFLSISPAKETYKIGVDTIHLKVEIPFKSYTIFSDNPIDVSRYQPTNIYFSITPRVFKNGLPDTIIPDPIGKNLVELFFRGKKTNNASRTWPFEKTDSSWLFSISMLPTSLTLSNSIVLLRPAPFQYMDGCVLIEYPTKPLNTDPNWHLPNTLLSNYRPYAEDFYFMLEK
jgi:hypothetical protein